MIWENWLVAISIGVIALAFVALVIFVILALISMKQMVNDLDQKVHSLDPLFRVVSKAGKIIEKKASNSRQFADDIEEDRSEERVRRKDSAVNTAMEVAEWAMIGLALWQKIKERKR